MSKIFWIGNSIFALDFCGDGHLNRSRNRCKERAQDAHQQIKSHLISESNAVEDLASVLLSASVISPSSLFIVLFAPSSFILDWQLLFCGAQSETVEQEKNLYSTVGRLHCHFDFWSLFLDFSNFAPEIELSISSGLVGLYFLN